MSASDSFFDPYAPPPAPKRGRRALIVILVIVALLMAGGGTAAYLIYRHQQQIEAENRQAQQLADSFASAQGEWQEKVAALEVPDDEVVLAPLYKAGLSSADQRKQVAAGCKQYATYAAKLAELPAPPEPGPISEEIAGRVPAYLEARETASEEKRTFTGARDGAKEQLDKLAGFCAFFDKEADLSAQLAKGDATWTKSMWPKGYTQVIGNYRYTCTNSAGCLPVESQWGNLAQVYRSGFIEPNSKLEDLYRDECPYDDLKDQCAAIAATLGKVVKAEGAYEAALKAKDPAALDKARSQYTQAAARTELLTALTKLDPDLVVPDGSDPAATVMFRAAADNLKALGKALPQASAEDTGRIAS